MVKKDRFQFRTFEPRADGTTIFYPRAFIGKAYILRTKPQKIGYRVFYPLGLVLGLVLLVGGRMLVLYPHGLWLYAGVSITYFWLWEFLTAYLPRNLEEWDRWQGLSDEDTRAVIKRGKRFTAALMLAGGIFFVCGIWAVWARPTLDVFRAGIFLIILFVAGFPSFLRQRRMVLEQAKTFASKS